MTAEVAIVNRSAVALAADSFATITRPGKPPKTYNVNKLFTLSKHAPVGVMVYGAAEVLGVPWETVVKVFRKSLKDDRLDKIDHYAERFIRFLSNSNVLFSADSQVRWLTSVVDHFLANVDADIDKRAERHVKQNGAITEDEVAKLTNEVVAQRIAMLGSHPARDNLPADFENRVRAELATFFDASVTQRLPKKPLTDEKKADLHEAAVLLFTRKFDIPTTRSGIVIAGFGEIECFPVVRAYLIHGVCCGQLIYSYDESDSFDGDGCAVLPFAQRDVANAFLQGIDDHNLSIIMDYVKLVFSQLATTVAQTIPLSDNERESVEARLNAAALDAVTQLDRNIEGHLRTKHIDPLLATVNVLPKEELAVLAEALVSLTSLKRKMSTDVETVGGPIDVAVISKGDGFIWIRRKHYFDPSINPSFVPRYLCE